MVDKETHRKLAVALFNRAWELMDMAERSEDQDDEMLSTAHASAYHWLQVGTPKNFSISQWQLSRIYAMLNRSASAIHHGQRALVHAEQGDLDAFYHAYGHEAVARGYQVAGERGRMAEHRKRAEDLLPSIEDAEDRAVIQADLNALTA
jgi:hypothetical protein